MLHEPPKIFMPLVDFKKKKSQKFLVFFFPNLFSVNGIHQDPNTFPKSPLLGAFPTADRVVINT